MNELSDEFKRRLQAYEKGELSGEELEKFEKELEKLEQYQEILEHDQQENQIEVADKKKKKILKRSKWLARIQTGMFAFAIFILFMIISTILTAIYYSWGTPDRSEVYANIIDYTLAVTDPYGEHGSTSTNAKPFFRVEMTRDLNKRIGSESMKSGELSVQFLFSLMSYPVKNLGGNDSQHEPLFTFPGYGERIWSDWEKLEKLPEGTVASAFISFKELLDTNEIFNQFSEKNLDIIWFAVDTGVEGEDERNHGVVLGPIGFPSIPLWHDDDMILESREESKGFLFGKVVSEGYSSPAYHDGDVEMLHSQFIKTLTFLEKYESKASKLYREHHLNLQERLKYMEENGIKHYGIVVTGPSKEILALKDMTIIQSLEVDEVAFWNWIDKIE